MAKRSSTAGGRRDKAASEAPAGASSAPSAPAPGPIPEPAAELPAEPPGRPPAETSERQRPSTRPGRGEEEAPAPERQQYLSFLCGGEEYAAGIHKVREILQLVPITRVPLAPCWLRGLMNLRGSVVPVVDLGVKLGLAPAADGTRPCIVLVEVDLDGDELVMGLVVDDVREVVDLTAEETELPPPFGTRVHVDYLAGVAEVGERFVLLLDIDRVLSAEELLVAVAAAGEEETASAPPPADGETGASP